MATYNDEAEAKELLDELFSRLLAIPESNSQFAAANAVVGVYYSDPEYFVSIDGTTSPSKLSWEPDIKADIEIRMSSETANTFWKGKLNFPVAMVKGEVQIKGPSSTMTKLLPAIAPGHDIYNDILKSKGKDHLIS